MGESYKSPTKIVIYTKPLSASDIGLLMVYVLQRRALTENHRTLRSMVFAHNMRDFFYLAALMFSISVTATATLFFRSSSDLTGGVDCGGALFWFSKSDKIESRLQIRCRFPFLPPKFIVAGSVPSPCQRYIWSSGFC